MRGRRSCGKLTQEEIEIERRLRFAEKVDAAHRNLNSGIERLVNHGQQAFARIAAEQRAMARERTRKG